MTNQHKAEQLVDEEMARYPHVWATNRARVRRLAIVAALDVLGLSFEEFSEPNLLDLSRRASEAVHL